MTKRTARTATLISLGALFLAFPALADSRIERELALATGGRFVLDADAGTVNVSGSARSGVRVLLTSSRDDLEQRYDVAFAEGEGEVRVTAKRKGASLTSWFNWAGSGSLRWEIEVPRDTALEIDTAGGSITAGGTRGKALLDTSGGSITVTDVEGAVSADTSGGSINVNSVIGDVLADTSGGSIEINGVRGSVQADTSGGSIQVYQVSGELTAETSGGSIHVNEAGGRVTAETSGGGIQISFTPGNSQGGTLSTSGGGIRVVLDPAARLEIDAETSGGGVTCDLPVEVRGERSRTSLAGRLNGGGERLKLRASGGPIRIEPI